MNTVAKIRRADFFPDDWLAGTSVLSLEERGAYITVCAMIYSTVDRLEDDDRHIAGVCRVDLRVWRRLKQRLFHLEKLRVEDGFLRNSRCTSEILKGIGRVLSKREAGRIGGCISASGRHAINGLREPQAPANAQAKPAATNHQPSATKVAAASTSSAREAERRQAAAADKYETKSNSIDPRWQSTYALIEAEINSSTPLDGSRIHAWLAASADPDLDILPTVKRVLARERAKDPRWMPRAGLRYFDNPIADALRNRKSGLPSINAQNFNMGPAVANGHTGYRAAAAGLRYMSLSERHRILEAEAKRRGVVELLPLDATEFLIAQGINPRGRND